MTAEIERKTSLLNLPAELRNEIYTLSLVRESAIRVDSKWSQMPPFLAYVEPALLRVNRQLRRETLEIQYSSNVFQCYSYSGLTKFVSRLGLERVAMLKHVKCGHHCTTVLIHALRVARERLPRVWCRLRKEVIMVIGPGKSWVRLIDSEGVQVVEDEKGWTLQCVEELYG